MCVCVLHSKYSTLTTTVAIETEKPQSYDQYFSSQNFNSTIIENQNIHMRKQIDARNILADKPSTKKNIKW